MLARPVSDCTPILIPILGHVTDGYDGDEGILPLGGHGRIKPGGRVDIQAGIGRQVQVAYDAFKIQAVVIRQEKSMRAEGFIWLIHTPEKADHRAGEAFLGNFSSQVVLWQELLVNVRQIGVRQDRIRFELLILCKLDTPRQLPIHINALHCRIENELNPSLAGQRHERLHDAIHTTPGIPHAMRQFGVWHHRESGRRFKWTQTHVYILEGEC